MPDHIRVYQAPGTWVVRAGGAVLAESRNALELVEGDRPPVIYFPRKDIAMAMIEPSATSSTCPHKGRASYHSIVIKSGTIRDAGWSYDEPDGNAARIGGHIAFYPDKVTIERL